MSDYAVSIGCIIVAVLLAVVCHPRVFFGDPVGFSIVSLDGLFYAGQWSAVVLSLVALVLSVAAITMGRSATVVWIVLTSAVALLAYLVATGIPHKGNAGEWRNRKLGLSAFIDAEKRRRKENAPPVMLTAKAFEGKWRSVEGAVYQFEPERVTWTKDDVAHEHSTTKCGGQFRIAYVQYERSTLNDHGMVWSLHASEVHDATPVDAKIPVAEIACGKFDRLLFIRASDSEVWRWTNSLDADSLKNDSYVLKRVDSR